MRHLIDDDLLALYQARKAEYAKHEPDFAKAQEAVAKEAAWNKEYVASALGLSTPAKTEARDALESERAVYNQSFDSLNRTRNHLIKEILNEAELEYVQAAIAMKRAWGQLTAVSGLAASAKIEASIAPTSLGGFYIPGAQSEIMRAHVQKCNHRWTFTNPSRDAAEWIAKLAQLREEIGI